MNEFIINVRAIVNATCSDLEQSGLIEGWDIYDFSSVAKDDAGNTIEAVIRCDQSVSVKAKTREDAIEQAKSRVTGIVVEGWSIDDVRLWCDEGIDIEETISTSGASSPTP